MRTGIAARPWLVVPTCSAMHITFAILYLINPQVGGITALHLARELLGSATWAALLGAALIAVLPMAIELPARIVHLCLWPQQLVLFLSAVSALQASYLGMYPDGVVRLTSFIYADQCISVYLMGAHLAALVRNSSFK